MQRLLCIFIVCLISYFVNRKMIPYKRTNVSAFFCTENLLRYVSFPLPLERAGTLASQPGPYFFEEIGERTPRGRRFLPLGTPFSGGRNGGRWFRQVGAWPAASKTNASWPAHRLGRAGEVVYCREEKVGTRTVTFCLLPKGTYPRPQPAQPVGGPLRAFQCEGRRPGIP